MGFFTKRERGELDKLRGRTVHEFVPPHEDSMERQPAPPYQDARPRQEPRPPRREPTPHDVGPLLARASGYSLQQIDDLIDGLQSMRDRLNDEAERVQSEMMAYARFSQATLDSTRVISESLRNSFPSIAPLRMPELNPVESSPDEQDLAPPEEATASPSVQAALSESDEPGLGSSDDPMPAPPSDQPTLDPSERK